MKYIFKNLKVYLKLEKITENANLKLTRIFVIPKIYSKHQNIYIVFTIFLKYIPILYIYIYIC